MCEQTCGLFSVTGSLPIWMIGLIGLAGLTILMGMRSSWQTHRHRDEPSASTSSSSGFWGLLWLVPVLAVLGCILVYPFLVHYKTEPADRSTRTLTKVERSHSFPDAAIFPSEKPQADRLGGGPRLPASESLAAGPAVLILAGLLALLAVGIALHTFIRSREKKVALSQLAPRLLPFVWWLPVAAVFGYVAAQAVPHFQSRPQVPPAGKSVERSRDVIELVGHPTATEISSSVPTWVRTALESQPDEHSAGTDSRVVISSRWSATIEKAEQQALQQAVRTVKQRFHQIHPDQGDWSLPDDVLETAVIRNRYVERSTHDFGAATGDIYRVHFRLDLSSWALDELHTVWRNQIVDRRLWVLGSLVGLLTLLLGTGATYFRLDAGTQGRYRRRLKFAAASLMTAGGLIVAALISQV